MPYLKYKNSKYDFRYIVGNKIRLVINIELTYS